MITKERLAQMGVKEIETVIRHLRDEKRKNAAVMDEALSPIGRRFLERKTRELEEVRSEYLTMMRLAVHQGRESQILRDISTLENPQKVSDMLDNEMKQLHDALVLKRDASEMDR